MNEIDFILANTTAKPCRNVSEIMLYQASEVHDLWHKTQIELDQMDLPPPFWAFAWAGGEALARFILDHPESVKDKTVLDFASGSGLVAIAAKKAGALAVTANDIDAFAIQAIILNSQLNQVEINSLHQNLLNDDLHENHYWDIILAGDIFYDKAMSQAIIPWLQIMAQKGCIILCGDPERYYVPKEIMSLRASFMLDVSTAIEETEQKQTHIWQFL